MKGDVFVISAPSGAGKTTVIGKFMEKHARDFVLSVSVTTRQPRKGEVNGRHYHFFSRKKFLAYVKSNRFLEHAKIIGNYYGTLKKTVYGSTARGRNVIMDVDVQGARAIKRRIKDCVTVFIIPPTFKELEKRLTNRKTDTADAIRRRLTLARNELKEADKYDYVLVNRSIDETASFLECIVKLKKMKGYKI